MYIHDVSKEMQTHTHIYRHRENSSVVVTHGNEYILCLYSRQWFITTHLTLQPSNLQNYLINYVVLTFMFSDIRNWESKRWLVITNIVSRVKMYAIIILSFLIDPHYWYTLFMVIISHIFIKIYICIM